MTTPQSHRRCLLQLIALAAFFWPLGGCEQFQNFNKRKAASAQVGDALATHALAQGGRRELDAGNIEQALVLFTRALEKDPNQIDAHIGIGDIHQVKGDYTRAAEQYDTARKINPQNFDANYKLGLMYHLLNRLSEAVATYLQALAINPDNFDANLNLATAYLQTSQPELAIPYGEKAVALNPESQPAYVNLGAIYSAVGRNEDAVNTYRGALDHGEMSAPIAVNLANALIKINAYERAVNTLDSMIRKEPRAEYYERLGYVHFKSGAMDKSQEAYQRALSLDARDFASLNGLGVIQMTSYLKGGSKDVALRDSAIASWQKSVRLNPDQPKIVDLISRYRAL